MLTMHIESKELFNERDNTFIIYPETELRLEHSLISLSRWESKWKKPFLNLDNPTKEELADYICCMSVDKSIDSSFVESLSADEMKTIRNYIHDPQTATQIYDRRPNRGASKSKFFTSEEVYYWKIYYGIPFSCEKWPLNRLLVLIRICGIKGGTSNQQMDMNAIFAQNGKLNAARRAAKMNGK